MTPLRLSLLFIITSLFITSVSARDLKNIPGEHIRVGVFPNPPVAFKDEQGQWRGISIDTLQAIANEQKWEVEYVEASFSQLLEYFEADQIDLISMMAYSDKRAEKYTFSKNPLISNWGLVYTKPNSKISSLLDLDDKRVGTMKNNIHDRAFRAMVKKFGLNINIIELATFRDVMKGIQSGEIDAGVVNRLFGALNANKFHLVETGIIFNPINIHYASLNPNNKVILDVIDQKLRLYKANRDSVYFKAIRRWMNQNSDSYSYRWLIWLAVGLFSVIIIMFGFTVLLRRKVSSRTHELQLEINERREIESKLDELAYFDSLTKLPNRISLLESLKLALGRARRRKNKVAVLFIDIDRFKTVNDSLGHDVGDQLIQNVATRLDACLRDEDSISRFGGDEFVAILQDIDDATYINTITERMLACFSTGININVTEIFTSVCIGIAIFPDDDANGENLLKYADAAMYYAKDLGGNNYQFYNKELTKRVQQRLSLETRLRHALERNEFQLYYQPIYNLKNRQIKGVEALIRWQDPKHGLIMPDSFIPLAEETGLIVDIGDWVLEDACSQVQQWSSLGLGPLTLSVNISSAQFDNDKLYSSVISTLKLTGLSADQLELEITERMFLNINDSVRNTLDKLTQLGVKLSIDDFGTGYSSLTYLKQLPIDTLKIDRSFIMGIPDDKDDVQIASTIVNMAHGLGMDVIAEGIETEEQLHYLNSLGCGRGQGYFLSKPQPTDEVTTLLISDKKINS